MLVIVFTSGSYNSFREHKDELKFDSVGISLANNEAAGRIIVVLTVDSSVANSTYISLNIPTCD